MIKDLFETASFTTRLIIGAAGIVIAIGIISALSSLLGLIWTLLKFGVVGLFGCTAVAMIHSWFVKPDEDETYIET